MRENRVIIRIDIKEGIWENPICITTKNSSVQFSSVQSLSRVQLFVTP